MDQDCQFIAKNLIDIVENNLPESQKKMIQDHLTVCRRCNRLVKSLSDVWEELSTAEKHTLGFEVLSDQGNVVAQQFGLVFTLPEELRPIYKQFGIDLPAANGDESYMLPIPATYVIDKTHTVVDAFVDADYTNRLEPDDLIAILKDKL